MTEWRDSDPFEDAVRMANQHTHDQMAIDALVGRSDAPKWRCTAIRNGIVPFPCNTINEAEDDSCGACGNDRPPAPPQ
jgi:hypothetical protein